MGWGGGPILHLSLSGRVDPSRAAYGQAGADAGVPGGPSPVETRVLLQSGLWGWDERPCTPPGGFPPSPPRTRSQSRSDFAYMGEDSGRNGTHPRRHACGQRRAMWFLATVYFKAVFCFSFLDHSFCSRSLFYCFKYPPALFVSHFLTFFLFFFLVVDFTLYFFFSPSPSLFCGSRPSEGPTGLGYNSALLPVVFAQAQLEAGGDICNWRHPPELVGILPACQSTPWRPEPFAKEVAPAPNNLSRRSLPGVH